MGWQAGTGLGLQAVSAFGAARNRNKALRRQQRAFEDAMRVQDEKRLESRDVFDTSVGRFTREELVGREDEAADRRVDTAEDVIASLNLADQAGDTSRKPAIVGRTAAREATRALTEGMRRGRAIARLGASADSSVGNNILFTRSNQALDRIRREAAAAGNLGRMEANAAFNNTYNPAPWQLLGAGGNLLTSYGISRVPAAGPSGPGPGAGPPIRL